MGLIKAGIFMAMLGVTFALGYWLGDHRLDDVSQRMSSISTEVADKTAALDREMMALKRRAGLAEARDAIDRARAALAEKNLGDAEREMAAAAERLQAVGRDATAEVQRALQPIGDALAEARRDLKTLKPRVQEQLRRLARRLDDLSRQWE